MSEQSRKLALKYRRHAAGDWSDEDTAEKELSKHIFTCADKQFSQKWVFWWLKVFYLLVSKALELIAIGDKPLLSMERSSLKDIIIALSS